MKHLNDYKIFEKNKMPTSKEEIDTICYRYGIYRHYTINEDGSIDVNGDVDLSNRRLTRLPLKFNRINRHFLCNSNSLRTLEGCPEYVGGFFSCAFNHELTSLEGSPKYVGGYFNCTYNKITSLEGCPEHIGSYFYCDSNPINSIIQHFIRRDDKNNLIELFNYYDIVQDKNVIYDRLKYFYEGIDVKVTDDMLREIKNKGYNIIR